MFTIFKRSFDSKFNIENQQLNDHYQIILEGFSFLHCINRKRRKLLIHLLQVILHASPVYYKKRMKTRVNIPHTKAHLNFPKAFMITGIIVW
jgi:ABC-type siderophore export system fused ATPase/permease subunit